MSDLNRMGNLQDTNLIEPVVYGRQILDGHIEAKKIDGMGRQEELVSRIEDHLTTEVVALKSEAIEVSSERP